ncbi:MAG: nucleotidyltransferase domain-containing protein [Oscillospiraceae bacterium]|nr:nucleotidyltransferase domain-containing protein [Oscillospiraceae bacterium]
MTEAYLYGSQARGTATDHSDVDYHATIRVLCRKSCLSFHSGIV